MNLIERYHWVRINAPKLLAWAGILLVFAFLCFGVRACLSPNADQKVFDALKAYNTLVNSKRKESEKVTMKIEAYRLQVEYSRGAKIAALQKADFKVYGDLRPSVEVPSTPCDSIDTVAYIVSFGVAFATHEEASAALEAIGLKGTTTEIALVSFAGQHPDVQLSKDVVAIMPQKLGKSGQVFVPFLTRDGQARKFDYKNVTKDRGVPAFSKNAWFLAIPSDLPSCAYW